MPPHHHSAAVRTLTTLSYPHKPTQVLHLHLPGLTRFTSAASLQETIIQRHFAAKDQLRQHASHPALPQSSILPPPPLVLTFSTPPTYTVGRRYLTSNPLPQSQISFLQGIDPSNPSAKPLAAFHASPRGGDLTYHGPGQLTAYAIIDLRTHNITPRCYVRLLEKTVMRTCTRFGVPNTTTTSDPGVWITESTSNEKRESPSSSSQATDRKICALGVQIRRGITAHGIGLNIHDHIAPPEYTSSIVTNADTSSVPGPEETPIPTSTHTRPGYLSWGFQRIIACGLEDKTVTWLSRESSGSGIYPGLRVYPVGRAFAEEFAGALGLSGDENDALTPQDTHFLQGEEGGQRANRAETGKGQRSGGGGEGLRRLVREITLRDLAGW